MTSDVIIKSVNELIHSERGRIQNKPKESLTCMLMVAAGGAIGSLLRLLWSLYLVNPEWTYAWNVFSGNVAGSLFLGLFVGLVTGDSKKDLRYRAFFATGVLGSFTTFSAVTFEASQVMLNEGHLWSLAAWLVAMITLGLVSAWIGIMVAKRIITPFYQGRFWTESKD